MGPDCLRKQKAPCCVSSTAAGTPVESPSFRSESISSYQLRYIDDLYALLKAHGDWMPLGSADEQKSAAPRTVEAWERAADNPVKGWYGTKKGLRGRFGMYVPPVLEALGLAELEHNPKNNRIRAE
jgi:hypothetical protein